MKLWRVTAMLAILMAGVCIYLFLIAANVSDTQLNTVTVNDIVKTCEENWGSLQKGDSSVLLRLKHEYDYIILDLQGNTLYKTGRDISSNLNEAIRHRDTIVDITVNGNPTGKAIIYNTSSRDLVNARNKIIFTIISVLILAVLICSGYLFYLNKKFFTPFKKLKSFAQSIADGNLDIPLKMDRNNVFGAFTESFDIMREELAKARENERRANQSKKELVAQLSHDIKTPVASIKAVSELMYIRANEEKEKNQLEIIGEKADQINLLISNMFQATLEELQELRVVNAEEESTIISKLISTSDYRKLVTHEPIPECIILCDKLRLQQVFDNIISNSYKYAGTEIEISSDIEERFLVITLRDFGKGVEDDELPLVFTKFYRGRNSDKKSGSGLGLYISKYFIEQMGGEITCENLPDGFAVTVKLRIA
ncbi:MAG: HAMP domain-containing sensor histidine kinase [Bacillota bacterium]|nr:HAMP domain-containing sensor histidine kinase [Bacillota bacterium]